MVVMERYCQVELFHPLNFQALGDKNNRINVTGRYQLYEIEFGDDGVRA